MFMFLCGAYQGMLLGVWVCGQPSIRISSLCEKPSQPSVAPTSGMSKHGIWHSFMWAGKCSYTCVHVVSFGPHMIMYCCYCRLTHHGSRDTACTVPSGWLALLTKVEPVETNPGPGLGSTTTVGLSRRCREKLGRQ